MKKLVLTKIQTHYVKYLTFFMVIITVIWLSGVEYRDSMPTVLQGRLTDIFAGCAQASLAGIIYGQGNRYQLAALGLLGNYTIEIMQAVRLYPGTFDWGDFVAFAVGAMVFVIFDLLVVKMRRLRFRYK